VTQPQRDIGLTSLFKQRIQLFKDRPNQSLLCCNLRGIEREALRVDQQGNLSQASHPKAFGSALSHPSLTTDYSEALLEFITEPYPKIGSVIDQLTQLQQYVTQHLPKNEYLWPSSMPCKLEADENIPIAQYGNSNIGQMKTIYRRGLGHRYGRKMQTIAGLHFNFSLPDAVWCQMRTSDKSTLSLQEYRTQGYMGLIRNFRRHFWLLLYLMGASPVIDKSFVKGREHDLETLNDQDMYLPYATSLRMGDLGYQSSAQDDLYVCYNSIQTYVNSLKKALIQDYPGYKDFRISSDNPDQIQQLSQAILQIENEFYSTIRPKQTAETGETQLKALSRRGVEYIEVRCTDINPFIPIGIDRQQIEFLELFLLGCLFEPSPQTAENEYSEVLSNQRKIVREGRKPGITLRHNGTEQSMSDWATELIQKLEPVAEIMDELNNHKNYSDSLKAMQKRVDYPENTPSARMLGEQKTSGKCFVDWSLQKAKEHRTALMKTPLSEELEADFANQAHRSLEEQKNIEEADKQHLKDYISGYFEQYKAL